jgi:hypothetical protein
VTHSEALEYVLERLSREATVRPKDQHPEALARKLGAIEALTELRDSLSSNARLP